MRVPFNALISLSAEAMPHARLPLPIKTCLYKVLISIDYCADHKHIYFAHHKHFCNSSACSAYIYLPQRAQPSWTMDSKAKRQARQSCEFDSKLQARQRGKPDKVASSGGMRQERVWGLSPGPHSRWDGASRYNRAIALGPIQDSMSCSVGIQRLYESQTHGVASHSSTNEGNPSFASTASKKQYMRDTLITSIHNSMPSLP